MIILDPNSDYVRLAELRDSADPNAAAAYASAADDVAVWQNAPEAAHPLRLQFADIDPAAQAALLGLDPIRDREEYAALSGILAAGRKGQALITGLDALVTSDNPDVRQLGLRAANLGVMNWSIWSQGQGRSLVDELEEPTSRCLVVDLGSLDTVEEQRLIAETVLSTLWRNRSPPRALPGRHRRGAQRLPEQPDRRSDRARHELRRADRRRGPQVRALPAHLHPAPAEGERGGAHPVRQPAADADELRGRPRLPERDVLLRAPRAHQASHHLRPGRDPGGAASSSPTPSYVKFGARMSQEGGADIPTAWANTN